MVGSGNSVTLRVHRGPTSSARNRSCNCNKPGGNSLTVKHVLVQQQSFNGIDGSPEESISGDKRAKAKSLPNCPNCNASALDPNNSNSNLLAFSSKLAKFKREKKAAKNLAIVVGKIHEIKCFYEIEPSVLILLIWAPVTTPHYWLLSRDLYLAAINNVSATNLH